MTSFHLLEASLPNFSWLYTLVCVVVRKNPKLSFICNYSHFSTHFAINHHEQNQDITFKLITVLLFDLTHKQWNGIIKGWIYCLTSELKGRLLVNNTFMFDSAWCLVTTQIQFSLIEKDEDWTSSTLVVVPSPNSLRLISYFTRTPRPPSKWTSYVYHPLFKVSFWTITLWQRTSIYNKLSCFLS